jgi:hypothetical protein
MGITLSTAGAAFWREDSPTSKRGLARLAGDAERARRPPTEKGSGDGRAEG